MKKLHQDVFVGLVMILFSVWAIIYGVQIGGEPSIVPVALAAIMLVFGAYVLADGIRKTNKDGTITYSLSWSKIDVSIIAYLAVVAYVVVFYILGYFTATFLFLSAMMWFLKVGSWKKILLISAITVVCLYLLFVVLFSVNVAKIGILI